MCLALPVQERCAILPVPERLNWAQCGFGHENRVYLSGAGVVSIIAVLLWQGMDQKIQSRRQLCHVTVLQDYPCACTNFLFFWGQRNRWGPHDKLLQVGGARSSSTYKSTESLTASTPSELLSKQLISVLEGGLCSPVSSPLTLSVAAHAHPWAGRQGLVPVRRSSPFPRLAPLLPAPA